MLSSPARRARSVDWRVPDASLGSRIYMIGLPMLWLFVAGYLVKDIFYSSSDALLAGLLMTATALSVEIARRVGQPVGMIVQDLLSMWWLPIAVLLPPLYVLLAPAPIVALTQWRVRPSPLRSPMLLVASIGLAYAAAALGFQVVLSIQTEPPPGSGLLRWSLAVGAAGVLGAAVNSSLLAVADRGTEPHPRWHDSLWDPENLCLGTVKSCVGLTIAIVVGLEPMLIVFAVPPVLLMQRGLLHAQLRASALFDSKTGLLNTSSWEQEATRTLLELRRRSQPAAVLLIDVDHFKRVNDSYGHLAGDQVLRAVADALSSGVREGDVLGRFGGEEFVALLPAADAQETALVAERLRDYVARLVVTLRNGEAVRVTVSIGVAAAQGGHPSVADLLVAADCAMYLAKAAGRNTVVLPDADARLRPPRESRVNVSADKRPFTN